MFYHNPVKKESGVNEVRATRIKPFIDAYPEAGYRSTTLMLNRNKNMV